MSNHESIYPAFADETYDPAIHTVATCARGVPLVWFGLFRPKDLITRTFDTDDGPYVVVAPIATTDVAIGQLRDAMPRLKALFGQADRLASVCQALVDAMLRAPGRYATIEWDEIAVITDGDFIGETIAAMASLEPEAGGDPREDRARLLRLTGAGRLGPPGRLTPDSRHVPVDRWIGLGPVEQRC